MTGKHARPRKPLFARRGHLPARLACNCLRDIREDKAARVADGNRIGSYCGEHGIQTVIQVELTPGRWLPHDVPLDWYDIRVVKA
jgi:hypothetical protein